MVLHERDEFMRLVDIAIAGGGLAGSTAAAMLARAGYDVVLVDPHRVYPPDFRCEKLDSSQVAILRRTGLAEAVLRAATPDREAWVARKGRLVDKRRGDQHGILYDTLVKTIRAEIPARATIVHSKVESIAASAETQTVKLAGGEEITARLVILANGLNNALRQSLAMERRILSPCHSVTIGFNMAPLGRAEFPFSSLSYYGETPADRIAYLTLFPVGAAMRANFMLYRDIHDPWFETFRENPRKAMAAAMPNLEKLTGDYEVTGHVKIRPADLYITEGCDRPGIVLVGDAFATSCPAAGTGTGKVFTDVERLCNVHVPQWLATPGMGADKIAAFYADPIKCANDALSRDKAYALRSLSIDEGLAWELRRQLRFATRWSVGKLRVAHAALSGESENPKAAVSELRAG